MRLYATTVYITVAHDSLTCCHVIRFARLQQEARSDFVPTKMRSHTSHEVDYSEITSDRVHLNAERTPTGILCEQRVERKCSTVLTAD